MKDGFNRNVDLHPNKEYKNCTRIHHRLTETVKRDNLQWKHLDYTLFIDLRTLKHILTVRSGEGAGTEVSYGS